MSPIAIELAVPALGWALLHFVWQGLVVGAAAGFLLRFLRGASPRWRYAVCAMALFICLCIPLTYLTWSLAQLGTLPLQFQATEVPVWRHELQARMQALVVAWSLGVGLMTLRLSLGLVWAAGCAVTPFLRRPSGKIASTHWRCVWVCAAACGSNCMLRCPDQ